MKISRRGFLKLASIWGVAVSGKLLKLPKSIEEGSADKFPEATCNDCGNGPCHPYFLDGGVSLRYGLFSPVQELGFSLEMPEGPVTVSYEDDA